MIEPAPSCSVCGRTPTEGETTLTWMRDTDARGRPGWVCPECTRANVRAVEAKLDQEWW